MRVFLVFGILLSSLVFADSNAELAASAMLRPQYKVDVDGNVLTRAVFGDSYMAIKLDKDSLPDPRELAGYLKDWHKIIDEMHYPKKPLSTAQSVKLFQKQEIVLRKIEMFTSNFQLQRNVIELAQAKRQVRRLQAQVVSLPASCRASGLVDSTEKRIEALEQMIEDCPACAEAVPAN